MAHLRYLRALLSIVFVEVLTSVQVVADDGSSSRFQRQYRFELTKGAGTPVCDAYLTRLNTAIYTSPPYCDRPEATTVPGFMSLNRVPLSAEEVHTLYPRVTKFMLGRNQGSKVQDAVREAKLKRQGVGPSIDPAAVMEKWLQRSEMKVWRYNPPVDIDNNGSPDNVLVWQGRGAGTFPGVCGIPVLTTHFELDGRQPQVAFILAASSDRLDVPNTIAIFGHPSRGYRLPDGTFSAQFRPIGPDISIFRYRDSYYFDTFLFDRPLESWGRIDTKAFDPKQANTLGVFLRRQGVTKLICEYRMTELATSNRTRR